MANFIADSVLDDLSSISGATVSVSICHTTQPTTTFGDIATYECGTKDSITAGTIGNAASGTGREVVIPAITDGSVSDTQTAAYWVVHNNTNAIYASGDLTGGGQAVTSGNTFTLDAISITIRDAT